MKGKCATVLSWLSIGWKYSMTLTLASTTPLTSQHVDTLISYFSGLFDDRSGWARVSVSLMQSSNRSDQREVDVMGTFKRYRDRDGFEQTLIDNLADRFGRTRDAMRGNQTSIDPLYAICLGKEVCEAYRSGSRRGGYSQTKTEKWERGKEFKNVNTDKFTLEKSIDIVASLTCPYVEFNQTAILSVAVGNVSSAVGFSIELRDKTVQFPWSFNVSLVGDRVQLCLRYLQDMMAEDTGKRPDNVVPGILVLVNYYTDIVCLSVSCVLLVVTISTYLLFPSLRTTPGLNTLCLCTSLLSANLSLIVTSVASTVGPLPASYCLFHAIFLHYSWIASFVWMSTCCVHMYRVFTGVRVRSKNTSFVLYLVCSFGTPACIVVLVIIITHTTTHGESIGYNDEYCFMDVTLSTLTIILGILTPLLISVFVNSILFFLTVREMFMVKKMQHQTRGRHGVLTYTKLSTVTGLFCLLSAAGAQFDSDVLSLLSTPFSALQGLFIFTSFTANKRVVGLYSRMIFRMADDKPSDVDRDASINCSRGPGRVSGSLVVRHQTSVSGASECQDSPHGEAGSLAMDVCGQVKVPTQCP